MNFGHFSESVKKTAVYASGQSWVRIERCLAVPFGMASADYPGQYRGHLSFRR